MTIRRVTQCEPCPICTKPDWCGVADDESFAICMRVSEGAQFETRNGGWLHRLHDRLAPRTPRSLRRRIRDAPDWSVVVDQRVRETPPAVLERHARGLGLPNAEALRRLSAFVCPKRDALAFPMSWPDGRIVGIRYRFVTGWKCSEPGSREGPFVPVDLDEDGDLWVAEGPTDTAALLALGLNAVGRPSCRSSHVELLRLAKRRCRLLILADKDAPGIAGARELWDRIAMVALGSQIIRPPLGAKDARDALRAGATKADFEEAADDSPDFTEADAGDLADDDVARGDDE